MTSVEDLSTGAVLAHLREMTRPAHLAIEGSLGLMDENLDIKTYRDVLVRLHGFWSGWEPQMAALLDDEAFLMPRRRQHLLAADLAALGITTEVLNTMPRCPLTDLRDAMGALGSLYVMEGSSLGGRLIQHNVERQLGSGVRASCSYFQGYGSQTGFMWKSFLARLNQTPISHKDKISQGALETFKNLGAWLALT